MLTLELLTRMVPRINDPVEAAVGTSYFMKHYMGTCSVPTYHIISYHYIILFASQAQWTL